jgi:hypothetical protein
VTQPALSSSGRPPTKRVMRSTNSGKRHGDASSLSALERKRQVESAAKQANRGK